MQQPPAQHTTDETLWVTRTKKRAKNNTFAVHKTKKSHARDTEGGNQTMKPTMQGNDDRIQSLRKEKQGKQDETKRNKTKQDQRSRQYTLQPVGRSCPQSKVHDHPPHQQAVGSPGPQTTRAGEHTHTHTQWRRAYQIRLRALPNQSTSRHWYAHTSHP